MRFRPRAFTLIELLVVIAIVAILAAILFPVFAQAKMAAKKTVTLSNVKGVVLAARMYAGDHDDVYAMTNDGWNQPPGSEAVAHLQLLHPYVKGWAIHWNGLDPLPGRVKTPTMAPAGKRSWGDWTFYTTIAPSENALLNWNGTMVLPRSESEFRSPAGLMMYAPVRGFSPGVGSVDFVTAANVCVSDGSSPSFSMYQGAKLHGGIVAGYADGHAGRKSLGVALVRQGILLQDSECQAFRKRPEVDEFFGTYMDTFYPVP